MLTQEEDAEIHALRKHGWSISAIARHASEASASVWGGGWGCRLGRRRGFF
jgi:hypothetical protein